MKFKPHALRRMKIRDIARADAENVVVNPTKTAPGNRGATNFWGYSADGFRLRVTVSARNQVITVAWADRRKAR